MFDLSPVASLSLGALAPTIAAGFILGVALGVSGVGGGVLLTPLLILFRVQPTLAVGTSMAFSLVTTAVGGWQHLRQGTIDRAVVAWLAAGSLPVALVTSALVNTVGRRLVTDQLTKDLVVAAVILSAVAMTVRLTGLVKPVRPLAGPALVPIGALLGFVFALTSVGSGSIAVATLVVVTTLPIGKLIGTDVGHAALMAAVTAPFYFAGGHVATLLVAELLIGSLPGVVIGSRLAARLPERAVKGTVLCAMWIVALRLA